MRPQERKLFGDTVGNRKVATAVRAEPAKKPLHWIRWWDMGAGAGQAGLYIISRGGRANSNTRSPRSVGPENDVDPSRLFSALFLWDVLCGRSEGTTKALPLSFASEPKPKIAGTSVQVRNLDRLSPP